MNGRTKPLTPEEIPVDLRVVYDFDSQRVESRGLNQPSALFIDRECASCKNKERVRVTIIRKRASLGKLMGCCRNCSIRIIGSIPNPKGDKSWRWKGGRTKDRAGYIRVLRWDHPSHDPKGYVLEHRLVMEKEIGRLVLPTETVHHKNGKRDDNRPDNLELWSRNHGDGARYEDLENDQIDVMISHLLEIKKNREGADG